MAGMAGARLEFRIKPEAKAKIEHAAALAQESASDFARTAAEARADEVLRAHAVVTEVPAEFFAELLAALDQPAHPNPVLRRAAKRARKAVRQRA